MSKALPTREGSRANDHKPTIRTSGQDCRRGGAHHRLFRRPVGSVGRGRPPWYPSAVAALLTVFVTTAFLLAAARLLLLSRRLPRSSARLGPTPLGAAPTSWPSSSRWSRSRSRSYCSTAPATQGRSGRRSSRSWGCISSDLSPRSSRGGGRRDGTGRAAVPAVTIRRRRRIRRGPARGGDGLGLRARVLGWRTVAGDLRLAGAQRSIRLSPRADSVGFGVPLFLRRRPKSSTVLQQPNVRLLLPAVVHA